VSKKKYIYDLEYGVQSEQPLLYNFWLSGPNLIIICISTYSAWNYFGIVCCNSL